MGSGVIKFMKLEVDGASVSFFWEITDDKKVVSGKDVMIIKNGLIQHQEVTLLTEDF